MNTAERFALLLTNVTATLNGGSSAAQTITYDYLQRPASVSRGNSASETTTLSYTLQGWPNSTVSTSWEEVLFYASPVHSATSALPGKAGLVTEWRQQQKGTSSNGATTSEFFAYTYDSAGRLKNSVRYLGTATSSDNGLTEQSISYDRSGNLTALTRRNASGTATETLSYSYTGPKRNNTGWSYDNHGNVTADPQGSMSVAWNVLDMPRTLTSGSASTQRAYLADGTLAQIYDGSTTRLYVGDMVFTRTGTSGTPALESAGWEGGRLLNGSGTDKVLYYVTDHLGSVRTIKDGSGTIRQRFDYYPFGTVSRVYTSSSSTDYSLKRYRFGGKEIAGAALTELGGTGAAPAAPYLDFGARLYSPRTATWLSVDPLAEKYYSLGPLTYCAGNPVNLVDPEGESWYYALSDGRFIEQLFDDDDSIYLLTEEQITLSSENSSTLQNMRDLDFFSNSFGQMILNGTLTQSVATSVLQDLFDRANHSQIDFGGVQYLDNVTLGIDLQNTTPIANSTSTTIRFFLQSGHYWKGYDVISTMAHEIGHILDRRQGELTNSRYKENPSKYEERADLFAKHHWSYDYISEKKKNDYIEHARIYGF